MYRLVFHNKERNVFKTLILFSTAYNSLTEYFQERITMQYAAEAKHHCQKVQPSPGTTCMTNLILQNTLPAARAKYLAQTHQ